MRDDLRIEEEQHLESTVSRIDEIIAKESEWLTSGKERGSGNKETDAETRRLKTANRDHLHTVRDNPYFGRVDFSPDDVPESPQVYYFGKFHIPEQLSSACLEQLIIGFGAPVCDLFYHPRPDGYNAPLGKITGTIKLKRRLVIEKARLRDIIDELPGEPVTRRPEDVPLTNVLSKPKGEAMQDIISTIKPEQYEAIAAAFQQVVFIRGVAGSGKSEVALHRVVYLLSPHNQLNLRISPERVVFFGPSRAFLQYVSDLLPDLRVPKIQQTTIRDWLLSLLSRRPSRVSSKYALLEKGLRGAERNLERELKVAQMKGSLAMARMLERHVGFLRKKFSTGAIDIAFGGKVLLKATRLRHIIRESNREPLNDQRKHILSRLEYELRKKLPISTGATFPTQILAQFDQFWPELDYRETYSNLCSNLPELAAASRGMFAGSDIELLAGLSKEKRRTFGTEDLAALSYLDHLLNNRLSIRRRGRVMPAFEHVVIDEAQDVSPLELLLVYEHSANKSFTILGDPEQSLLTSGDISGWRELERVFSKESIGKFILPVSYRATFEITKYSRRIFTSFAPPSRAPKCYHRHGKKPILTRSKSYADMVAAIARDISSLSENEVNTIAVLCKTFEEAKKIRRRLVAEGIIDAALIERLGQKREKITVASIYQAKGLEYDAVILANARRHNYEGSILDDRLLYVGATRAAHHLHIHWFGTLAEVLAVPALLGRGKRTKRTKVSITARKTRSQDDRT